MNLRQPGPILVVDLFPETLDALIDLLAGLSGDEWERPTSAGSWTVKDVAQHLLGGDIGLLSRKRDRYLYSGSPIKDWGELVALINELNAVWVKATSRMSPRVLCDLLRFCGDQASEYFRSLDPFSMGDPVDWVGPDPAPVWLDIAREYTERWHHQQQIRDATGRPGLKEPKYMAPVLDAFVRALPRAYRDVEAEEGTIVGLTITGESGGRWFVHREGQLWNLYLDSARDPYAEVVLD
ncbi:MAG TPA: maleylpyruvate isomerase family mycothiol-dependent enzyme, partial [Blastocatellia bacterium]|nr:maleylpyruvate isomerase family mycothiol-dependent enzyme [Blastocatellia bacterium]